MYKLRCVERLILPLQYMTQLESACHMMLILPCPNLNIFIVYIAKLIKTAPGRNGAYCNYDVIFT